MSKNLIAGMLTICLSALCMNTFAGERARTAEVIETLNTGSALFGGCMVKIVGNFGVNCTPWAAFSCTGDFVPKDQAYRMYDAALLGFALKKKVTIWVDDAEKHNGHCVATRIDVTNIDVTP